METKKLERIILLILALLNLVLLFLLLRGRVEQADARRARLESLTALLSERGIELGPDADLDQDGLREYTVQRDLAMEDQRMQGILGTHDSEDQGGGIWYYHSDRAKIVIHGTGELTILPLGAWGQRKGSPYEQAARILRSAGIDSWVPPGSDPEDWDQALCCCWEGAPVFNAVMEFGYSARKLDVADGVTIFNRETARSAWTGMDAVSVLLSFAETVRREGIICSRVDSLTAGYRMRVGLSGESTLEPVWRLATDVGEFYVSGETGAIVTLAE